MRELPARVDVTELELFEPLTQALVGGDVEEAINVLTYLLAESLAQATDREPDADLIVQVASSLVNAYNALCCNCNDVTLN